MKFLGFFLSFLAFFQFTFGGFLDNVVIEYDKPAYVSGPNMNTLGGGGIRFRWQNQNIALFNITPPSLKKGCSGIDLGLGSLGLLNFEEFGRLFEALMGPAGIMFAFNLALSALCPQCQQILDQLASLANQLNQMQIDQCGVVRMAGALGKALGEEIATQLGTKENTFNQALKRATDSLRSLENKIQSYLNRYCPNGKCGLSLMLNGGCLMDVVAHDLSFLADLTGGSQANLAAVFRYYFGDICFPKKEGLSGLAGIPTQGLYIPRQGTVHDFIAGFLGYVPSGVQESGHHFAYSCENKNFELYGLPVVYQGDNPTTRPRQKIQISNTVCRYAKQQVEDIINRIHNRQPLTPAQIQLLSSIPIPIYKLLNYGSVYPGFLDSVADKLQQYIVVELTLALLSRIISESINTVSAYQAGLTTEEGKKTEASEIIRNLLDGTADFRKDMEEYRIKYIKQLREAIHSYELADKIYNSMLAQMAYSPIYGNLVFSKLIGVRF